MKSFLNLFVLLALGVATAHAAPVPRKAWYVCSRLNPDAAKSQCYGLVDRYRYFNDYAAGECDRYDDSWLTVSCMQTIAGKGFSTAGVTECDRYTDANQTTQCLATIAGRELNDAAVAACARIQDAGWTTACLGAIADKHYRDWEVRRCDSYSEAQGTIQCFRELGW